jgi:hypothetical protein
MPVVKVQIPSEKELPQWLRNNLDAIAHEEPVLAAIGRELFFHSTYTQFRLQQLLCELFTRMIWEGEVQ